MVENRGRNSYFLTPVKFGDVWAKCMSYESILRDQPSSKPLMYFWWNAARPSGRLKSGCYKRKQGTVAFYK